MFIRATTLLALLSLCRSAGAAELTGRVVDEAGTGLGDAVVYVREMPSGVVPGQANRTAVIDQVEKEFVPRLLVVPAGTEVSFPNHDQIHHHVYSFSRAKSFELPLYKGEQEDPVVFDTPGAVKLGCNIHDWMYAVIFVAPTPFFAVTSADGSFRIGDLPPGTYGVSAWHDAAKAQTPDTRAVVDVEEGGAQLSFRLEIDSRRSHMSRQRPRRYE